MNRIGSSTTLALVAVLALAFAPRAGAVGDPSLKWRTIETPHFRVNYHEGLGKVALRVAAAAERAHERLTVILDYEPKWRTEITVTDEVDAANGWAITVPFNQIHVYASAPSDMSTLQDYDDWYLGLVIHEYTHVLHMDTYSGVPEVINSIFGKVYPPNNIQPRWILEGLAVIQESTLTTAGRLNASQWEMMMRMAVLDDRFEPIDVVCIGPLNWPHGTVHYLYGSYFLDWVTDAYGDDLLAKMSHDYGKAPLPFGINRTVREITGRTWPELYADWFEDARATYAEQRDEIAAPGLRTGMRLTDTGEVDSSPRWSPDGARIAYYTMDGHDRAAIVTLDMAGPLASLGDHPPGSGEPPQGIDAWEPHRVLETTGQGAVAWTPDGDGLVFARSEIFRNWYAYHDLYWVDLEQETLLRLTEGGRCRQPDVSPDGELLAYTVNGAGTSRLAVAAAGSRPEPFVQHDMGDFGQVYAPRFSPDGRKVAYSGWSEGGLRDLYVLDLDSGETVAVTSDRYIDSGPAWGPHGRHLYFSSDRTGVFNVWALDLEDGSLRQVTNVLGGAFQPDVSPDGRTLLYLGYHARGYDLYAMELDPSAWLPDGRLAPEKPEADLSWTHLEPEPEPTAYNPLRTLLPRYWMFSIQEDGYGQALTLFTTGADVAGHHSISAEIDVGLQGRTRVGYAFDYSLLMLPFDISVHHSRTISPRWGLRIDDEWRTWPELRYSGSVALTLPVLRTDWAQYFTLSYRLAWMQSDEPIRVPMDPNAALPHLPDRGWLSGPTLSWFFTNAFGSLYGFSREQGFNLWASVHADLPALGSDYSAVSLSYGATAYFEMPWVRHHVMAFRFAGGYAWSNFQRRGYFTVGGFAREDILLHLVNQVRMTGAALRGYPPGVRWGDQYYLFNAEYRLPVVNIFRGISTLPWSFNRIFVSLLSDTGGAFGRDRASWDDLLTSVGAEVHLTMTLGYWEGVVFKVGYARGLMDGAIHDFYVLLASPF